jgi:hypothetical protein
MRAEALPLPSVAPLDQKLIARIDAASWQVLIG